MEFVRQTGESLAAFRGRERRERADAVDALGLKAGDPISFAGKATRFDPKHHTRSDRSYMYLRRLSTSEIKKLELIEAETEERNRKHHAYAEQQAIFRARPEVQAAESIRWIMEDRLEKIIDKLTPAEWIALAARLDGK